MSAATAASLPRAIEAPRGTAPRAIVLAVLTILSALAVALFAASFVPSATLAGRLIANAPGGTYTQELQTYLDDRLRFAAALLIVLAAGLTLTRPAFEDLVAAALHVPRLAWSATATLVIVGFETLVAIGVRVPFLAQPMRYDEALTFNEFASRPLYYGLSFYPDPNNHLLNTLLMHAAYVVFGNQPWALRLPAFVAGVLLVPATYVLTSWLFDDRAGVLAAAVVAVSSYLVEYSTNARGYTLQALCFVVMLSLVVYAARRRSLGALLGAALIAAVGAYAVPTMLYGVAVAAVWLLLQRRFRPTVLLADGLVLGTVVAVVYLPVMLVSGPDKLAANRFVTPLDLAQLAQDLPRSFANTWAFWNRDVPLPLAGLLVIGFALGSRRAPIGLLAILVCLVLVLLQRVAPFERVWLFLLPLYVAVASGGLARFVDGRLLAGLFGAVMGFVTLTSGSILSSTETGTYPDAEGVAQTLGPRLAPDDAVLTMLPTSLPELQYYFPRAGLPTNVLVRSPDEAQNLWVLEPPDQTPQIAGWPTVTEIQRYPASVLFELKRQR